MFWSSIEFTTGNKCNLLLTLEAINRLPNVNLLTQWVPRDYYTPEYLVFSWPLAPHKGLFTCITD